MATFTVTNLKDSGAGSLRAAVALAEATAGADVVVFASNLAGGTITLTSGELTISSGAGVTINGDTNGDGDFDITLSGDVNGDGNIDVFGDTHHVTINAGASATLQSLKFTGGGDSTANGAGSIKNFGTTIIERSVFDLNAGQAGAAAYTGAGHILNAGNLTLRESGMTNGAGYGADGFDAPSSNVLVSANGGFASSGAGCITNGSVATLTLDKLAIGDAYASGGNGGDGGDNTYVNQGQSGYGGNGGQGGHAVRGILNFGTQSGSFNFSTGTSGTLLAGLGGAGGTSLGNGTYFGIDGAIGNVYNGNANFNVGTLTDLGTQLGTMAADARASLTGGAKFFGIGGNDTISGSYAFSAYGGAGNDTIINSFITSGVMDGGMGNDTFDVSGSGYALNFDLNLPVITIVGTQISNFENIIGTSGVNIIKGNNVDNLLEGHAGGDTLTGGGNTAAGDTVSYNKSNAAVTVNLALNTASGGHASGDTISGFENVTGSNGFGDNLTGSSGNNVLKGLGAVDTLNGELGNDTLIGGVGGDSLNGGGGLRDLADYSDSNAAVSVSINGAGSASGGHAAGDTLTAIEDLTGSAFGDTLVGNIGQNILRGGAGADTLSSSNNNDQLFGGNGNDTLNGGAGVDIIDGGAGSDTVSFAGAGARITLTLDNGAGTATGSGQGSGDVISNIENITGSSFNDILTGDANANTILGGAGNDTLNGGGGADTISGQGGLDVMNGGTGNDTLIGGPDADRFIYNIAALWNADTIIGWQNGTDLIDLQGAGFDFADFTETQVGADTLLTLTANTAHSIRLVGINANTIDAADFV